MGELEGQSDIAKMLTVQHIEQRKSISGLRGRASRTGRGKPWRTAIDMLDKKERREYKAAGLVFTYKEGEEFMPLTHEEFLKIEDGKVAQYQLLTLVKENSDTKLGKFWGVPEHHIKRYRKDLGLIKDRRGNVVEIRDDITWPIVIGEAPAAKKVSKSTPALPPTKEQAEHQPQLRGSGFQVYLRGEFAVQDVVARLEAIKNLLASNPEARFQVIIELTEA